MENKKKYLKSREIEERLAELIQKNYFHFQLKGLTRHTRDLLSNLINGLMERIQADPLSSFHLFSGIMEALLNALKANLKYIIFKKELLKKLKDVESSEAEIEKLIDVILDTSSLRDAMQRYVVPQKVKKLVQTILSLEEKIRVRKLELSPEDKDLLYSIRERLKIEQVKISLVIQITETDLRIDIINDSPVMDTDIERIYESRKKHNELWKEGKSTEFFRPEHLDEKESAGFGIAMIDEGFYNMGLNPLDLFTYETEQNQTKVHLRYPLEDLRKGAMNFL